MKLIKQLPASCLHQKTEKVLGNQSLTISRKPVGAWVMSQPLIPISEQFWMADAHRDDGKRFVVHADERLTAFLELEAATRYQPHAVSHSATHGHSAIALPRAKGRQQRNSGIL
jgi:hypothetical protein